MDRESLATARLVSGYGNHQVIGGIDLRVAQGEVVALVGHNGAGKSTLLKTIFGLLEPWSGSVMIQGKAVEPSPETMLRMGTGLVLQGGRVFTEMTVRDHIKLRLRAETSKSSEFEAVERVTREFPELGKMLNRRAGLLSGGERQMLSLGVTFLGQPRFLLLDEPSLGLSPRMVDDVLAWARRKADKEGVGVLLVEQKVRAALEKSDRVYVLRRGLVSYEGSAKELLRDSVLLRSSYL